MCVCPVNGRFRHFTHHMLLCLKKCVIVVRWNLSLDVEEAVPDMLHMDKPVPNVVFEPVEQMVAVPQGFYNDELVEMPHIQFREVIIEVSIAQTRELVRQIRVVEDRVVAMVQIVPATQESSRSNRTDHGCGGCGRRKLLWRPNSGSS